MTDRITRAVAAINDGMIELTVRDTEEPLVWYEISTKPLAALLAGSQEQLENEGGTLTWCLLCFKQVANLVGNEPQPIPHKPDCPANNLAAAILGEGP